MNALRLLAVSLALLPFAAGCAHSRSSDKGSRVLVAGSIGADAWFWDQPRFVVDQLCADTIRLRLSLGWSGNGIAAGSTDLEFVLGAGIGLLALVEDGIERTRQTP